MAAQPIEKIFCGSYLTSLLLDLNKERNEKSSYCDVTLQVDGQEFKAHKCILGKLSSFFDKMFKADMKEKYESFANMQGLSSSIMEVVLDFIYTANIKITDENVKDLLAVSDYLQIGEIKRFCIEFFNETMTYSNCISVLELGKLYNCCPIIEKAEKMIVADFEEVTCQTEFKEMSSTKFVNFIKALQSANHKMSVSKGLYEAVLAWVNHDIEGRKNSFVDLFKIIELHLLPSPYLKDLVSKESLVLASPPCTDIIQQSLFWASTSNTVNTWKGTLQKKKYKFVLICKKEIRLFDMFTHAWIKLPDLICDATKSAVVEHEDFLYVIGGTENSRMIRRIDIENPSEWQAVGQTLHGRVNATCIVRKNAIIILGGDTSGFSYTRGKHVTAELYAPQVSTQHQISKFLSGHFHLCAVCDEDCIYIFDFATGENEKYIQDVWTSLREGVRCEVGSAVLLKKKIYIFGMNLSVQSYHCDYDGWSTKNENFVQDPFDALDCTVMGDTIYILGRKDENEFTLLEYNPKMNKLNTVYTETIDFPCSIIKAI